MKAVWLYDKKEKKRQKGILLISFEPVTVEEMKIFKK